MQMICEHCGHSAPPADVWLHGAKLALECAGCGQLNRLELGPAAKAAAPPAGAGATESTSPSAATSASSSPSSALLQAASSPSLLETRPSPAGLASAEAGVIVAELPAVAPDALPAQCPKCGNRQVQRESCARCGFLFAHYVAGSMPWEQGLDAAAVAEAESLWAEALRSGDAASHERFAAFCLKEQLEDFAGRRYRFRLADRPDDVHAKRQLDAMFERGRVAAFARLESERSGVASRTQLTKRRMLVAVAVVAIALGFLLFHFYPNLLKF